MMMQPAELQALIAKLGGVNITAEHIGRAESTIRTALKFGRPLRVSTIFLQAEALREELAALKARREAAGPIKPRVVPGKEDKSIRIIAIGDTHDSPILAKDRLRWIGKHCAEKKPDRIVHIGDFCNWDSVSAHEERGSFAYAQRPSFRDDLQSCEEAMGLFYKEVSHLDIPQDLVCGNHEDRIIRFENKTPETVGTLWAQFEDAAARHRWRLHQYGQWLLIDGVGFIHVPLNIMGKPYGGQNCENAIANHATHSIVFGHTHRSTFRKTPKIGANNSIEIMNLGSAMPSGYVARYAGTATTGWSYGIYELEIRHGHIVSHNFISMDQLERLYA
jgi:predicted phosphodiesterase